MNLHLKKSKRSLTRKSVRVADTSWDTPDLDNYIKSTTEDIGQVLNDHTLMSKWLRMLAIDPNNKTFLEIGTWNGLGSTRIFVTSLELRNELGKLRQVSMLPDAKEYFDYIFYSLECNEDKSRNAANYYSKFKNVYMLNEVLFNELPSNFNEIFPKDRYNYHNMIDLKNMAKCELFLDRDNLPDIFDVVLLDGGAFTTYFEFQMLKDRCNYLLLDDIRNVKNKKIVDIIKDNPTHWAILEEDLNNRNGTLICKRIVGENYSKMRQVTENELQLFGDNLDWYALKDEIPDEYKEDFDDDIIFELVRPWPLEMGNQNEFRDIFHGQGGTMDYRFLRESLGNYIFFKDILQKYSPTSILEVGTNSCIFGWFCYKFLDDFELHTVDINGYSQYFVDQVNTHFSKDNIYFYNDDSPTCINRLFFNKKFDLAFLDAGHTYEHLYGEMQASNDLEIPVLIVDDWSMNDLDRAINDFIESSSYKLVETKAGTKGSDNTHVGYIKVMENDEYY